MPDPLSAAENRPRPFVFFLSSRESYRETIISPNEVFCGPDCIDDYELGIPKSVKTPIGAYDLKEFFDEKGLNDKPEIILVKADATGRNFPRNLSCFKCPKVLLVGVTHFLERPIRKLIDYAKAEEFDFIIMDVTRNHAHWFQEAGLKNVHWLPALEYNPHILEIPKRPKYPLTFVGQAGAHHPFRKFILEKLKADGLPLQILQAPQKEAARIYADSLLTLNITLNADVNMRFFEVLAAGGFMLSDRLSKSSGLHDLFTAGEDFDDWDGIDELKEKIKFYMARPELVYKMRSSAQAKFLQRHSPDVKIKEFWDLILHGNENPIYQLPKPKTTLSVGWSQTGLQILPAYEFLQEMHRINKSLHFYAAGEDFPNLKEFVDFPRVRFFPYSQLSESVKSDVPLLTEELSIKDFLFLKNTISDQDLTELLFRYDGQYILAPSDMGATLCGWGFAQVLEGVFECRKPLFRNLKRAVAIESESAKGLALECLNACENDHEAMTVAELAMVLKEYDIQRDALLLAIGLNRDCVSSLVTLAEAALDAGMNSEGGILLNEADRVADLPQEVKQLRDELLQQSAENPVVQDYADSLAGGKLLPPQRPLRILVVTNLFPPQELGGYGRKLWEFSAGLLKRGHAIHILTSDADYLAKEVDASEMELENHVHRSLRLFGEWRNGTTSLVGTHREQAQIIRDNALTVLKVAHTFKPDVVLLGNLDYLGVFLVNKLLENKIPVIHSLGNETPGYSKSECITSPLYALAPCSDWLGSHVLNNGYSAPQLFTVYPGARMDRFYRFCLPDIKKLRIAYASLLMPYKGVQVLVQALMHLHNAGLDFEAEIAGDSTDQLFVDNLVKRIESAGISHKVRFIGYQGRRGLSSLFARSNVLVFPSQFDEPFGITQVEAMAAGLIVITSGKGGTREVIQHEKNGLIFEAGNPVSLAQNLLRIVADRPLSLELQKNSRERAVDLSVMASVERIEFIAEHLLSIKKGDNPPVGVPPIRSRSSHRPIEPITGEISDLIPLAQSHIKEGRLMDAEDVCRAILGQDDRCSEAWYLMGRMAFLQGDLESAADFSNVACELDASNAAYLCLKAEIFLGRSDPNSAEQTLRAALSLATDSAEIWILLGRILNEKGDCKEALNAFQKGLAKSKDFPEGLMYYGLALQKAGKGKEAITQLRKAVSLAPESAEYRIHLGVLLEENQRYLDALTAYEQACQSGPNVGFGWYRKARLLNRLKKYQEAIEALEKALKLPPNLPEYSYEMGLAHQQLRSPLDAARHFQNAASLGLDTGDLHCNLGVALKDLNQHAEAVKCFYKAVKHDPANVNFMNNLGAAALEIGWNTEALACFQSAVDRSPELPTAHNNIGNLLKDRARADDALDAYRKSLRANPKNPHTQSNFLLCLQYLSQPDPQFVFEEHRKWGAGISKSSLPKSKNSLSDRSSKSKLRIGLVSPDLCQHPVSSFIEPLLANYDHEGLEIYAYSDVKKPDSITAVLSQLVDKWCDSSSFDNQILAKQIQSDAIDILIDLAGHTAWNRMEVFAMKPAPIQVTYLGYPSTTGLPTMDFRLTDEHADPVGNTEAFHTEKLIRLPDCAWCYKPHRTAPPVHPLPALENGFVTFGCFNNMAKWNAPLYELWANILQQVPNSHLRLKAKTLIDVAVRDELIAFFSDRVIDSARLEFSPHTQKIADHFAEYHKVDIALDSFPYHGTTTTCEAMWMGVPVITLAGKSHVSRVGVSLLNAVSLPELIAQNPEEYIQKAVELSANLEILSTLRAGFRDRMAASVLTNAPLFAKRMGEIFASMSAVQAK